MKLPSISEIKVKAFETFLRFPFVMFATIIGSISLLYLYESESIKFGTSVYFNLQKFIMMCGLSVPLFAAVSFFDLRSKLKIHTFIVIHLIIISLLVIYYFTFQEIESHSYRFVMHLISSFLLMTFSAFLTNRDVDEFWEFNKIMLLRLFNSLLFSFSLILGLFLAIAAIKELFKVEWSNTIFLDVAVIILGIFNTWYFLSGIPQNIEIIKDKIEYPKLLKLFSQYILIPLSVLYLIILYSYTVKIIVQWQLPIGWTSGLIIAYSLIGILAILLLYPLNKDDANRWSKKFSNLFFKLLFPLLILMALAINQRISDYGITEPRYLLIVLNLWLFGISLYFTFSKGKSIKVIPITLFIVIISISYGPWSAFSVSENSQISRVMNFLDKHNIIQNGKLNESAKINVADHDNLKSIIYYLKNNHKLEHLISEIDSKLNEKIEIKEDKSLSPVSQLLYALSIADEDIIDNKQIFRFEISDAKSDVINITDYSNFLKFDKMSYEGSKDISLLVNARNFTVQFDDKQSKVYLYFTNEKDNKLTFDLKKLISDMNLRDESILKTSDFKFTEENSYFKTMIIVRNLIATKDENNELIIDEFHCDIFINVK